MYNAVIFDMDGVLIDAREWHYLALNEALEPFDFAISLSDHQARFNGLSTHVKLGMLSKERGLPIKLHTLISNVKQDRTLRIAATHCFPNVSHQILLARLKEKGIKIGLVTNSIRETTEFMLKHARIFDFFDGIITNQDVSKGKPSPEGYLKCMRILGVSPNDTLVVEDGEYGRQAATEARCEVLMVESPSDVNLDKLSRLIPNLID
jgi:HAD superfamily hydrolase (TIGR01509 family)